MDLQPYPTFDDNGSPSTIVGMVEINSTLRSIETLCFLAPETEAQTTAISHGNPDQAWAWWIDDCAFIGYDVAVDCSANGFTLPIFQNLFVGNDTAVRINCGPCNQIEPNNQIRDRAFLYNNTAIEIVRLPDTLARHEFRVTGCDFINNSTDLQVPDGLPYYFHENCFGDTSDNSFISRAANTLGNTAAEIVELNPVVLSKQGGNWWLNQLLDSGLVFSGNVTTADVLDEPLIRALTACQFCIQVLSRGSHLVFSPETYCTDLLNRDADRLTIDSATLENRTIQVHEIQSNQELLIGTWKFLPSMPQSASLFYEPSKFNAKLERTDHAVTIVPSEVFAGLITQLTLPWTSELHPKLTKTKPQNRTSDSAVSLSLCWQYPCASHQLLPYNRGTVVFFRLLRRKTTEGCQVSVNSCKCSHSPVV